MVKSCKSAQFVQQSINSSLLPSEVVYFCHWCMADWRKALKQGARLGSVETTATYFDSESKLKSLLGLQDLDSLYCPWIKRSFSSGLQTDQEFPTISSPPLLIWDIDDWFQVLSFWKTMLNTSPKWDHSLRVAKFETVQRNRLDIIL